MTLVTSLEHLRSLASEGTIEARIALAGGVAFSRKSIEWDRESLRWHVVNHIDDTYQRLTDAGLWEHSNIGTAIDRGALFVL